MGTTLTGTEIKDTYDSLLKITDNGPLSGTAKYLSDGLGNDSVLALSTTGVGVGLTSFNTYSAGSAITIGRAGSSIWSNGTGETNIFANIYYNGGYKYSATGAYGARLNVGNTNGTIIMYTDSNSGTADSVSSLTERMRITSAGNVGIGTSSPSNKLDIRQSASSGSDVAGVGAISIGSDNAYWTFRGTATSLQDLAFDRFFAGNWSESMRIQRSTGNVGIGTSSPSEVLHIKGNQRISAISGNSETAKLDLYGNNSNAYGGSNVVKSRIESTTAGGPYESSIVFSTNDTSNNLQERIRITTNGLTFNGDTAAANALDDYEEGTFTATLKGSISDPTTAVTTTGYYTKIGRFVNYTIAFNNVNTNGASGVMSILGLPYTSANIASVGTISSYNGINWGSATSFNTYIPSISTVLYPLGSETSASWTDALHNPSASVYIWMNGTYFV